MTDLDYLKLAYTQALKSQDPSTQNTTMYGAWVACSDCARDIIEAGIKIDIIEGSIGIKLRFAGKLIEV